MKTKRISGWRWLGAGLLLALCTAVAALGFGFGTDPGRHWLAQRLSEALTTDSLAVRAEGIRVSWPLDVAIERVVLADAKGAWLEIRAANCRWAPLALLAGHIEIRTLQIGSLELSRLPVEDEKATPGGAPPHLPDFAVEAVEFGRVRLASEVCGVPVELSGLRGRVAGRGGGEKALGIEIQAEAERLGLDAVARNQIAADIKLSFAGDHWGLAGTLAGSGFRVESDLGFFGSEAWPTGTLRAEVDGASGLAQDLCSGLSADRFALSWDCPPRQAGSAAAQVKLAVNDLGFGEYALDAATVEAHLRRLPAQPGFAVEADARAQRFSFGDLAVTGAELHVEGPWGAFELSGEASGEWVESFALDLAGRVQWAGDRAELEMKRAAARWADLRVRFTAPLSIQMQGDQSSIRGALELDPIELASVANGKFKISSGQLAADLRVGGTLGAPEFEGSASCRQLAGRADAVSQLPPVEGACRFSVSGGVLRVSAAAAAAAATNGSARLKAQVPVQISLVPWNFKLDRDRDSRVEFDAGLDLAMLNGLDAFANGRIGGRIDLSVAHLGSISSGAVTGACVLVGGEYENYSLGTVIRDAQLRMVSSGKTLVVESGSATDGGKGRLTLSGKLHPDPAAGLPYELEIDGRQVRWLRRPDAEVMASGRLALAGTLTRLRASGDVQIDNALVNLGNLRPPPPAELAPGPVAPAPVAPARVPAPEAFALRLAIAIPGSLYVRSGMLDTAWAGNLVLAHEHGDTDLSGYLEPRRGTVLLLKRPFKLDEGRIDFDGRWPPEPSLRLTAVYDRADLRARARITGPARDPEVSLTSEPPLPEDEILSRILFGENMSSLTPLQAISLASEASKLRNLAGGGGVLDGVQAAMGVDRIEFRETGDAKAEPEVAVGKYLGDKSYIEMRRAATIDSTGSARVFLERELWPNVVLEAESGLEMRSGLGLFWRRDY